jgi:hypothetical protein
MSLWSRLFGSRQPARPKTEEPQLAPIPRTAALNPESEPYEPFEAEAVPVESPEPEAGPIAASPVPPEQPAAPGPPAAPKWLAPPKLIPRLPPLGTTPITPRQLAALQSVGIDAAGWTDQQARVVLAARDYFEVLFAERGKPPGRYKEMRLSCIKQLLADERFLEELPAWAAGEIKGEDGSPKALAPGSLYDAAVHIWRKAMKAGGVALGPEPLSRQP